MIRTPRIGRLVFKRIKTEDGSVIAIQNKVIVVKTVSLKHEKLDK